MKAILVIDVDDVSRYHADVYKNDDKGNGDLIMSYLPFKQTPHKKDATEIAMSMMCEEVDSKICYWVDGYNACIEELLGETDEDVAFETWRERYGV